MCFHLRAGSAENQHSSTNPDHRSARECRQWRVPLYTVQLRFNDASGLLKPRYGELAILVDVSILLVYPVCRCRGYPEAKDAPCSVSAPEFR